MQPDDVQTSKAATFYHLELQQPEFCDIDINNNQSVDSRFTYLGIQTNEFEVQSASNVLPQLRALPRYIDYCPADLTSKTNTLYSFFARSTIPWSLSCEKDGKTRDSVLAVVSDNVERSAGGTTNLTAIVAGGFVALFIMVAMIAPMACNACCPIRASDPKSHAIIKLRFVVSLGGILGAVWMGMGVLIIVYNKYADNFFGISLAKI